MRTILFMLVMFMLGCEISGPTKGVKKTQYCVHNGYSSFSPKCSDMSYLSYGIVLQGCESSGEHNFTVWNPTNVTECE